MIKVREKRVNFMSKLILPAVIIISLLATFSYGEEVSSIKVNKYIEKMEALLGKYPDPWNYGEGTVQFNEYKMIVADCALTDLEYLEALNILTKDCDIIEMCNKMQKKEIIFDQNIWNRGLIFIAVAEYLNQQWMKKSSPESVLKEKIVPIVANSKNPVVIRYWIVKSGDTLRDINNAKLPMSEENRDTICNTFIDIFNKEGVDDYTKSKAVESWSVAEKRKDKIISNVENISKNKILFRNTAFYLFRGNRTPKEVIDKMFDILENNNKYSEEIVDGALDFFGRVSGSDDKVLINRLTKVVNNKLSKNIFDKRKEKYENISRSIEWHEKHRNIKE